MFHSLKKVLGAKGYNTGVGDEGGFAPDLQSNEEAVEVILEAIKAAGYTTGRDGDFMIALDPAASELYDEKTGKYCMDAIETESVDELLPRFWPPVLEQGRVADRAFATAYAALPDRNRAWIKTGLAALYAALGGPMKTHRTFFRLAGQRCMFVHIFTTRLKCLLRDRGTIFWTMMFPIVLALLFNATLRNIDARAEGFQPVSIAVINDAAYAEDTPFQKALEAASTGDDRIFSLTLVTREEAESLLEAGTVSGYYAAGDPISVTAGSSGFEASLMIERFRIAAEKLRVGREIRAEDRGERRW